MLGRRGADQRQQEARGPSGDGDGVFPFDLPYPKVYSAKAHAAREKDFARFEKESDARNEAYRAYTGYRLDLRDTNLQGYDLSGGCWRGARFDGARMQGARILHAQMRGAELRESRMQGAHLYEAQMQGADLYEAQMQGAILGGAKIQEAVLWGAGMEGQACWAHSCMARNWTAKMQGAELAVARMQGRHCRQRRCRGGPVGRGDGGGKPDWHQIRCQDPVPPGQPARRRVAGGRSERRQLRRGHPRRQFRRRLRDLARGHGAARGLGGGGTRRRGLRGTLGRPSRGAERHARQVRPGAAVSPWQGPARRDRRAAPMPSCLATRPAAPCPPC
ncbi:MAG: pentapeptide repeat-containing protein [Rhodobacteraceae bacterium]|nr:pentapeptide repeat-containing protein [Paracoccaceae bacterium]